MNFDSMRIALVFHGLSGGVNFKNGGQVVPGIECFNNIKENLIEPSILAGHEIGVFYHTWYSNQHNQIKGLYKPINYKVEPSKKIIETTFIEKIKISLLNLYLRRNENSRKNNVFSKWYSFQSSLNIFEMYKDSYDLVISLRFDMFFKKKVDINKFDANKINLGYWTALSKDGKQIIADENISEYDIDSLVELKRGYPLKNEGLHDFFIATNPVLFIKTFKDVYDNMEGLIKEVGLSNHNILLQVLKQHRLLDKINYSLKYIYDYTLYRWL